jgi:protein phosphatase
VDPGGRVLVVADGIAGSCAGQRASQLAVDLLSISLASLADYPAATEEEMTGAIKQAFATANAQVVRAGRRNPGCERMGTTVVMALLVGPRFYIANIGDSRAYLVRRNHIQQLATRFCWPATA